MSLEKVLEIKEEFNLDNCMEIIFKAFNYQSLFNVSYCQALTYVRLEYINLNSGLNPYSNKKL